MKNGYSVTVKQTDEIGGETITRDAVAHTCRTLTAAHDWCVKTWGTNPSAGSRIVCNKTRTVYDVPFYGKPVIEILD